MSRTKQQYYRGKYIIGIYSLLNEGETLLALCDSVKEFARLMKIKESNARMILQKIYTGKSKHIVYANKLRCVEFINTKYI